MIDTGSIKHKGLGLKQLATRGRASGVPRQLLKRIRNRLAVLEAATAISDLPSSYRAHELTGRRRGTWSIWVNGPWRMTFRFRKETVYDLDLGQYH